MKLLLLTSEFAPLRGGISTYAAEMAHSAAELGADVTLYAPSYGQAVAEDDRARYPYKVVRFPGERHTMAQLPAKMAVARAAVRSRRFDVVHAVDWPFFLPVALSTPRGTRRVFTVHGSDVNEMRAPIKAAAISLVRPFSDAEVVANSGFTRDLFRSHFGAVSAERVRAEWLGVSDFWFGATADRAMTRRNFGIAQDAFLILTVARLTPRKGHLDVVDSLSRLPAHVKAAAHYVVVGPKYEGDYASSVERAGAASGCRVTLTGELPDEAVRDLYQAADAFCLTGTPALDGLVEGFGLVYLEAGAQGLPSIAGDVGGMPEAVKHEVSGLVVRSGDPDAIARELTRLYERPELRAALAAGAAARARDLSWRRCAAATYDLSTRIALGAGEPARRTAAGGVA